MGKYNDADNDLAKRVADLERRLKSLESGNRGGFTSIDSGGFRVNGGTFEVGDQLYFGPVTYGSDSSDGWVFQRANGKFVFTLEGGSNNDQYWAFRDDSGNIVLSDDAGSNQGLARPWLPISFYEAAAALNWTTVSATFQTVGVARFCKQLPRVQMDYWYLSGTGTTGEAQLVDTSHGIVVGAPFTIPANSSGTGFFGANGVNGNFGDMVQLELQARRTGGTGNITIVAQGAYNIQSA